VCSARGGRVGVNGGMGDVCGPTSSWAVMCVKGNLEDSALGHEKIERVGKRRGSNRGNRARGGW